MPKNEQKNNLTESLKKLQEIVEWFENGNEMDIEKGLTKVKEGVEIIKASKERLKTIENEFKAIQKEIHISDEER